MPATRLHQGGSYLISNCVLHLLPRSGDCGGRVPRVPGAWWQSRRQVWWQPSSGYIYNIYRVYDIYNIYTIYSIYISTGPGTWVPGPRTHTATRWSAPPGPWQPPPSTSARWCLSYLYYLYKISVISIMNIILYQADGTLQKHDVLEPTHSE